jgi:hypothetical protein
LLTDIDDGRLTWFITKDLSRLGRDYIQTGYYTDIYFSRKKVRYIAVMMGGHKQGRQRHSPVQEHTKRYVRQRPVPQVKSAKRQRAYSGYYISAQPPYGYKVDLLTGIILSLIRASAAVVKKCFR